MSDDSVGDRSLWETHASWWQAAFTDGADAEYAEQIVPMASAHLAGAHRVLDVGTGEGQLARTASETGARGVVGVDPSWGQLAEARKRGGGPRYLRGEAVALPFASSAFDAVLACLVFEHIEGVDAAIAEVGTVAADAVSVPVRLLADGEHVIASPRRGARRARVNGAR